MSIPIDVVAIEEHIILPDDDHAQLWRESVPMIPDAGVAAIKPRLIDVGQERLTTMDSAGIGLAVLSNVGTVQPLNDARKAEIMSREANDYLAKVVADHPSRYQAFATIALQDPESGAAEFERAVTHLGMKGAMMFGPTGGAYLDDPKFDSFWTVAEHLDVPVYLHPASPVDMPGNFKGREELAGAVWGWTVETATHFLRLVFGGIFERHPHARVILGHMGETIPYLAARFDSRAKAMGWSTGRGKTPSEIFRENLFVSTSGVFADAPLRCAIDSLGASNVLFSLDHPFESADEAMTWFRGAGMSKEEYAAVARENACRVLKLPALAP